MRQQLGEFLRRRRELLSQLEVGLLAEPRRRTPGLRREEVAGLAYMSTRYYERLEQGRGPQPSIGVLARVSEALRLSDDERDHLWDRGAVAALHCLNKEVHDERVGRLDLECSVLTSPLSRQRLLLMQPVAGTPAGERLERLATHS
jgi:transcriptional regulator with XRE-family HTH domain